MNLSQVVISLVNFDIAPVAVCCNESFHDRFLIVDDRELYLIGTSLKILGRKCFGLTKMDKGEIHRKKETFAAKVGTKLWYNICQMRGN